MLPAFLFRPLTTALDDKVALQDCLELGRKAKVEAFFLKCILLLFFSQVTRYLQVVNI